jgi:putative ATP-binding cassette transporter
MPRGRDAALSGELGLGKAALIQAIAGLWPWGGARSRCRAARW